MASGMTPESIVELLRLGWTQNKIAEHHGVSRQAVSNMMKKYGIRIDNPRKIAMEHYPWKTGERFHEAYENRVLRDHVEYMATGGKGMAAWKLRRLQEFYKRLQDGDLVVEFDPELPPQGVYESRRAIGGFALRPRRPSDKTLIIRVNKYTYLTAEAEPFWEMPEVLPYAT